VGPPRVAATEIEIIREDETRAVLQKLRGRTASSLIAAGLDVLTISRRLGHASPTITLSVYGHLFTNTDDKAAEVMEDLFAKVSAE
jgi:integrase